MAKKKLTATQLKANRRKAYTQSEYYKTLDAIDYLRDFMKIKDIKIPKKITRNSLKSAQKTYRQARQQLQRELKTQGTIMNKMTGEVVSKLQTKKEIIKEIRQQEPYRKSRATPKRAPKDFIPEHDFIMDIRHLLDVVKPKKDTVHSERYYEEKILPKYLEAKNRLLGSIDYAIMKIGEEDTAAILASNQYIQRIQNLNEKYIKEILEDIDDDLIPLIGASIGEALNGV